jgi:uncharacterized protein (DUF4415 family)
VGISCATRLKKHIVRYSAEEIAEMIARGGDRTDWARVKAVPQETIEKMADEDEGPPPEQWEGTIFRGVPPAARNVHIRLDSDIIDGFKAQGRGYQARINAALRAFVQSHTDR